MDGARSAGSRACGHIIIDGVEAGDTMQCCHCNAHFLFVKGSGKRRGFCLNCYALTCGKPGCNACIPFEKKLDLYEKGKLGSL